MELSKSNEPSCFARRWRVYRKCCCRYGIVPAMLAPVLSAALLLSLYNSAGCRFIDLQVGFVPSNAAWNNSSHLEMGLFYVYDSSVVHDNNLKQQFLPGCVSYNETFADVFMAQDRTWTVARIMAAIAAGAGGLCVILIWLMVIAPVPTNILWPALLLPITTIAFIAESSKFIFFDVALCTNPLWLPSGVDSLPQTASSCSLGQSGIMGVAATVLLFVSLLMVCLKSPEERSLHPDYGLAHGSALDHTQPTGTDDLHKTDSGDDQHANVPYEQLSEYDESVYTNGREPSVISETTMSGRNSVIFNDLESGGNAWAEKSQNTSIITESMEVSAIISPSDALKSDRISESRLSKLDELAMTTNNNNDQTYIQALVEDLDLTLGTLCNGSAEQPLSTVEAKGLYKTLKTQDA